MTECAKCGKCCKAISFAIRGMKPNMREWLLARGGVESRDYVVVPQRCPHLREDNTCDIHDSPNYPKACRDYHGDSHRGVFYVPPGCALRKTLR